MRLYNRRLAFAEIELAHQQWLALIIVPQSIIADPAWLRSIVMSHAGTGSTLMRWTSRSGTSYRASCRRHRDSTLPRTTGRFTWAVYTLRHALGLVSEPDDEMLRLRDSSR